MAVSLLEAPLILCSGDLSKLLCFVKFDCFHFFKSYTFQGVFNWGKRKLSVEVEVDAMPQTAIFFVVYCELHYGGILVPLNKNTGLQFGLVEHSTRWVKKIDMQCLCVAASNLTFLVGLWS